MSLAVVVEVLLAALVIFGVGAVITARLPGLADVPADDAGDGLPSGPLQADDLADARFPLAFRGYRMADVDAVLARLAEDLRARDDEIDHLRGTAPLAPAAEAEPEEIVPAAPVAVPSGPAVSLDKG